MKNVTRIILIVVLVAVMVVSVLVKAENVNVEEKFDGAVYGEDPSVVYGWLCNEWVPNVGNEKFNNTIYDDGVYRGYGVVDACAFKEEYGLDFTFENMESVLAEHGVTEFDVVTAGFYDDYTVYKLKAKAETESIGTMYNYENEEWQKFYDAEVYFMVVFKD